METVKIKGAWSWILGRLTYQREHWYRSGRPALGYQEGTITLDHAAAAWRLARATASEEDKDLLTVDLARRLTGAAVWAKSFEAYVAALGHAGWDIIE